MVQRKKVVRGRVEQEEEIFRVWRCLNTYAVDCRRNMYFDSRVVITYYGVRITMVIVGSLTVKDELRIRRQHRAPFC